MGRLTQQALFLTLEKASHLAGGMLLLIAVARLMGGEALGDYAYVIAVTSIFVPLLDAGLNTRVIRAAALGDADGTLGEAVGYKVRLGVLAVLVMCVVAVLSGKSGTVHLAVFLVGISTWATSLGDVFNGVLKGKTRAQYSALLVGGTYFFLVFLGVSAMVFGAGLLGIAGAYVVCRVGFLVGACHLVKRDGVALREEGVEWQRVWAGLRFLPSVFFIGVLLNINYITADMMGRGADSGMYAIGYRVGAALFVLGGASMEGVLPALSRLEKQGSAFRRLFLTCLVGVLGVGIFGVVLVHLLANWAVVWIFGVAYVGAVGAVETLSWILPGMLVCAVCHTALLALGREREGFLWMAILLVVGAIGGVFGFMLDGASGTAWTPVAMGGAFGMVLVGRMLVVVLRLSGPKTN